MRINQIKVDSAKLIKEVTIQVKVEGHMHGFMNWRKIGLYFFKLGAYILGCKIEIEVK